MQEEKKEHTNTSKTKSLIHWNIWRRSRTSFISFLDSFSLVFSPLNHFSKPFIYRGALGLSLGNDDNSHYYKLR